MVRADASLGTQNPSSPSKDTIVTCTVFYRALIKPRFSGRWLAALLNQAPSQRGSFWASMYASRNAQYAHGEARARTCAGRGPRGARSRGDAPSPSPSPSPIPGRRGEPPPPPRRGGNGRLLVVRSRRLFAHFLLTAIRQGDGAAPTQPGRSQNSPETSPLLPPRSAAPGQGTGSVVK